MYEKRKKKTVLVDLDGVLNEYDGRYDPENLPKIKSGAKDFLEHISENFTVKIFTTRPACMVKDLICENSLDNYVSGVTNYKESAVMLIDDRCLRFEGSYSKILKQMKTFTPWYKKESR